MKEQTNGERFDEFMDLVKSNEVSDKEIKKYSMTAVEWIISQYIKDGLFKKGVYEQAMEMERKQILDAFEEGSSDGFYGWGSSNKEQYYNETFKIKK